MCGLFCFYADIRKSAKFTRYIMREGEPSRGFLSFYFTIYDSNKKKKKGNKIMSKTKKFVKENKKKIIGGVAAAVCVGVVGTVLYRNKDLIRNYKLFKELADFDNNILERLNEMQKCCDLCVTAIPTTDTPLSDVGASLQPAIDKVMNTDAGKELATKTISGIAIFVK